MKLKDALKKNQFIVTSEVQSPVEDDPEKLIDNLQLIRGRVDGVSVSEIEIDGVVGDTIKTCDLLKKSNFQAIYQTTTRQKNRLQLQKDLINAHDAGVENLLVFTEDYRLTGDSLQEMMFFHVDAGKLSSVLDHLKDGQTIEGDALPRKTEFLLGSGVESSWGKNVPRRGMEEMEDMMNVGTQMPPNAARITTEIDPKIDDCSCEVATVPIRIPYPDAARDIEIVTKSSASIPEPNVSAGIPNNGRIYTPKSIINVACKIPTIK